MPFSDPTQDPVFKNGLEAAKLLMLYHRYEARGLNHIPAEGAAVIALSHSFATYDAILFGAKVFLGTGRHAAGLADRRIFQTPLLSQFFTRIGSVEGSHEAAENFLREGRLLMLSPGGMRESLRSSSDKYRVDWEGRLGFVRLAIRMQVPILVAACPAADDLYTLYDNPVTPAVYKLFKWPAPLLRGWGLSLLPRPVRLTHHVSKPFRPPPLRSGEVDEADVRELHGKLVAEMARLMRKG